MASYRLGDEGSVANSDANTTPTLTKTMTVIKTVTHIDSLSSSAALTLHQCPKRPRGCPIVLPYSALTKESAVVKGEEVKKNS